MTARKREHIRRNRRRRAANRECMRLYGRRRWEREADLAVIAVLRRQGWWSDEPLPTHIGVPIGELFATTGKERVG